MTHENEEGPIKPNLCLVLQLSKERVASKILDGSLALTAAVVSRLHPFIKTAAVQRNSSHLSSEVSTMTGRRTASGKKRRLRPGTRPRLPYSRRSLPHQHASFYRFLETLMLSMSQDVARFCWRVASSLGKL